MNEPTTNITRTIQGRQAKRSAMPPQTPASTR
jgi:hypothetical protein